MNTVYYDAPDGDDLRRTRLYDGQLYVYSPRASTRALCDFARELAAAAFAPWDPRDAQHHLPVEQYVAILASLKPNFIHHPRSRQLLQDVLAEFGCDLAKTYFDVPRMRTATHGGYLSSGLAYAFHPHRDTWYSAPQCQLNWWLPVYEFESSSALAIHPRYWHEPVKNGSREYDYARWNEQSRHEAARHIKTDSRPQPRPEEPIELDPQLRLVFPPGAMVLFSAAQLHSTVPNTSGRTRLSIDFRTVHLDDLEAERGAPNLDSECTGTTTCDYLRGTDLAHLPAALIDRYRNQVRRPQGRLTLVGG